MSETLDASEITAVVGVSPDYWYDRGTTRAGSALARRFTTWELDSGLPSESPVEDHVEAVLQRAATAAHAIADLANVVFAVELAVVVRCDPDETESVGVGLTDSQTKLLGALGASLDIEVVSVRAESP